MEKKTVLVIFLVIMVALFIMGFIEVVAGAVGGTPLIIGCYVIIGLGLIIALMRISKKTEGQSQEDQEQERTPED